MSAELALAVVALVDLCLKYGNELQKLCSAVKQADDKLEELFLLLDSGWYRCMTQLEFLKRVHARLDDSYLALQERILRMLVGKLQETTVELKRVVKPQLHHTASRVDVTVVARPVRYAWRKAIIDKAMNSIQLWQKEFDPTWFLMLRISDTHITLETERNDSKVLQSIPSSVTIQENNGLRKPQLHNLTLSAAALDIMEVREIRFSSTKVARSPSPINADAYILDSFGPVDRALYQATKKSVRDLASSLRHDEPENFGILCCKGFIPEVGATGEARKRLTLVFRIPAGLSSPQSFREYLINTTCPSSLSCRFYIARELAKAVSYVHTFGFVHKNIRPETILCFNSPGKDSPSIFLAGFDNFRKEDGRTQQKGDNEIEKNLYRHPYRQGISPEAIYIMQHDIYSLGVCLLEIGLWKSFIEYNDDHHNPKGSPIVGLAANATDNEVSHYLLNSSKEYFVSLAQSRLKQCMGTKYAEVVHTCLTCLDPNNDDFGNADELEDEDGILVGIRYIEKVLFQLNSLNV